MDMRKFTEKTTLALQAARVAAQERGNQEIGQFHLLYALLTAEEGLISELLQKMQKDVAALTGETEREMEKLPKVRGGEEYISRSLAAAIEAGEEQAKKMGDSYLSVEHLFFGLLGLALSKIRLCKNLRKCAVVVGWIVKIPKIPTTY